MLGGAAPACASPPRPLPALPLVTLLAAPAPAGAPRGGGEAEAAGAEAGHAGGGGGAWRVWGGRCTAFAADPSLLGDTVEYLNRTEPDPGAG
eukprot:gene5179-13538_t